METLNNCKYILSEMFAKESFLNKSNFIHNFQADSELIQ